MSSLRKARDGGTLPEPRRVSYTIHDDVDAPHHIHTTMLLQWGQFIDHDVSLTAISKISPDPSGICRPFLLCLYMYMLDVMCQSHAL